MAQTSVNRDFSVSVPDDWTDRTMTIFAAPAKAGQAVTPNILVASDRVKPGEDLSAFVSRQVHDLKHRAQDFRLKLQREGVLDGRDCIEIVFRWNSVEQGFLQQRQVYAMIDDARVMTITNTARESEFEVADQTFQRILGTFSWARAAAG
ncbi:DcrB-related protein [Inquilinus limosus]|uniref:DUF1795 domain-containing protein n=1 Tax=Inquilinus limosus TaxID=171674 RepID=A0A211Z8A4_9PROT|nr:DcrB-related protein [Inquilinus limosus]OWJ61384.1 hypothetical protein BWR60_31170 [Inquilinus limosus]